MDVLIVEALDPEVLEWLGQRHRVSHAPQLAQDLPALRRALIHARTLIIPRSVALDVMSIQCAPMLRAVGRLSGGVENIDLEACARAGVEVVRPVDTSAVAEAEFCIAALLQMLRRVPVLSGEGMLVGRELSGTRIGIIGMAPAARPLTRLLGAFGAGVVGYDPAKHNSDGLWVRWAVKPVGLSDLMQTCDGVCVLLPNYSRYRGLLGERLLGEAKPNQVLVSLAHSSLFDDAALADTLTRGRLAAAWFDSMEPGMLDAGRPLRQVDTLQVTPRVASTTLESRLRSAWAVARRLDELLAGRSPSDGLSPSSPDALADLAAGPTPG
jgi:phosphoglycerate dehydrogenase-like enzyme